MPRYLWSRENRHLLSEDFRRALRLALVEAFQKTPPGPQRVSKPSRRKRRVKPGDLLQIKGTLKQWYFTEPLGTGKSEMALATLKDPRALVLYDPSQGGPSLVYVEGFPWGLFSRQEIGVYEVIAHDQADVLMQWDLEHQITDSFKKDFT